MTFRLTLATPDKTYFDGPVTAVVCPGMKGSFGVLTGHAPMVAGLSTGILKLQAEEATRFFVIDGGLAEVDQQRAEILADNVAIAEDETQAEEKLEELKLGRHWPVNLK